MKSQKTKVKILKKTGKVKIFLRLSFLFLLSISFYSSVFVPSSFAATGINKQINFQGKLANSDGTNVADSSYTVVFTLYDASSGGNTLWTETDSVTTTSGIFQVALGATTLFPGSLNFNSDSIYLGIKVGSDAEMTPRIRFSAVPYAFNAAQLDGVVATQSANGFNLQGGTSTSSVASFNTASGALTFEPGIAEGLTLDTNGGAALNIGNSNATSLVFGNSSNNPTFTFNNGTGTISFGGSGTTTFSGGLTITAGKTFTFNSDAFTDLTGNGLTDSSNALTLLLTTSGNTANTSSNSGLELSSSGLRLLGGCSTGQVLQYNTSTSVWACGSVASGTNYWQSSSPGTIDELNNTMDLLLGGTSTNSADFAFMGVNTGTPTASISSGLANNSNTYLTGTGVLGTTSRQSLILGSSSTGDISFEPGGKSAGGSLYLASNGDVGIGTTTPSGTVDIRANSGTLAIESISGSTAFAGLVVNNSGSGDIFTASKSGTTKFVINSQGNVGIGAIIPLATLDVRANSGTLPVASISGNTAFAGLVVNNSGNGDLFTASSSGTTRFQMTNNGSTVFKGDTITSIGSGGTNTTSGAVENAMGDEGSLVPNAGFESAVTGIGFSDGWAAAATNSAIVTRDTTTSAKGQVSAKVTFSGASQSTAIYSTCMPLALQTSLGSYNLNFYAKPSVANRVVVRGYIDAYTSKANCESNTTPSISAPQGAGLAATTWATTGSGTTGITFTSTTNTWGKVHIFIGCPASCTGTTTVNIDGVRLIENANSNGVDYAEDYPADPNDVPQPGDVVSLEASGSASIVAKSRVLMDQSLVGVVSTNPGYVLDDGTMTGLKVAVALAGRVPVNVSTINGPIHIGDYLTSSTIPGVAVKATGAGPVIGTAMEEDTDSNMGDITQVTMFIKNTYYNGAPANGSGITLPGAEDASIIPTMLSGQTASVTAALTDLSTDGLATVSGDLRVKGNGLIEGVLHVADTLFANNFIANGVSDFFGNVIFHSGVTFDSTPVFDSDTAGFAVITKGSNHVDVTFSKSYDNIPIINASITVNPITPTPSETLSQQQGREVLLEKVALGNIHYIIMNRTTKGFTILLARPAKEDLSFSWVALAVNSPQIFQSKGSNIQMPTPSEIVSPSPMDTIIPSTIPVSPVLSPTDEPFPTPTPGG